MDNFIDPTVKNNREASDKYMILLSYPTFKIIKKYFS